MSSSAEALYTHTKKKITAQLFNIGQGRSSVQDAVSSAAFFNLSFATRPHCCGLAFFFFIAETRMDVLEQKQNQPTVLWVACQKAAAAAVDAGKDKSAAQRHKHSALPPALQLPFARLMHTFPLLSKSCLRNNTGLLFSTSVCLKCLRFNHCQPT